jgi:hypothetical protein
MDMLNSKFVYLFLLIVMLPFTPLKAIGYINNLENESLLTPGDGDFVPDTVNVFRIAKDVSGIFMDAIEGDIYHDVYGDATVLNDIFLANYATNDIGNAYKDALEEQIRATKGDIGVNIRGDFTENFSPGISIYEDLIFKRRFFVGLEWDIIKGGFLDANNKIHKLKMEAIIKEYESLEYVEQENYRYLFNYINYIFNKKKVDVLKERRGLVEKQLEFTKELYHLRYVGWEKVLDYQSKLEDIDHQIFQYENFNEHIPANIPDTLLTNTLSADDLPLFDVNLDSLMKIYYNNHSEDTITKLKLAIYKDNIKWWKDISVRPFLRYNTFMDEFNVMRNFGSAGVSVNVPLRFHNKQKLIKTQEAIYESEQQKELQGGDNELVNIYAEFGFKLKQIKEFYYEKMLNDELIRKELVKKEYRDVAFNPVFTLGLIDDKKAIESEIIDIKKRMYINLVRLAFYLEDKRPTDFITILKPEDFVGRYNTSVKMLITQDDLEEYETLDIANYIWKNDFNDVLVENDPTQINQDMNLLLEKTKLANTFYSIMRKVPVDGQYPDVNTDVNSLLNIEEPRIIGVHYELDLLSNNDGLNEVSEVDISNWVDNINQASVNAQVRLSIGIPQGLGINVLNNIFAKFDLVFVHENGIPNRDRVEQTYASELNLDKSKLVLTLKGMDFADRMHLEKYMSNLYENSGISNFGFSDYSSMSNVDYRTFEKGHEINLQPGQLVASVREQIYSAEDESNSDINAEFNTETEIETNSNTVTDNQLESSEVTPIETEENTSVAAGDYKIQIAASKVKLSDEFLSRFNAESEIREIKVDGYYKYTIGNYSEMNAARSGLADYRQKSGNAGAFIVTY